MGMVEKQIESLRVLAEEVRLEESAKSVTFVGKVCRIVCCLKYPGWSDHLHFKKDNYI